MKFKSKVLILGITVLFLGLFAIGAFCLYVDENYYDKYHHNIYAFGLSFQTLRLRAYMLDDEIIQHICSQILESLLWVGKDSSTLIPEPYNKMHKDVATEAFTVDAEVQFLKFVRLFGKGYFWCTYSQEYSQKDGVIIAGSRNVLVLVELRCKDGHWSAIDLIEAP